MAIITNIVAVVVNLLIWHVTGVELALFCAGFNTGVAALLLCAKELA